MNEIIMTSLDEKIYHEKLDSGLNVYVYKSKGFSKKGAYFFTKYGSSINDFKPINEDKIVSFPKGIAHFLEHKLFESEDNEKVFDKFKKYGARVNAYTSHFVTNYYFSTNDNFFECLSTLIDFVWNPYFTDENVEKEKGIINQEINMTNDDVERFMFEEMFSLALVNNPNKYRTIGDKKNVSKITKEDLYRCYNTFYHPSNMFLVVYGDVDVKKTFDLIKEKQNKKKFSLNYDVKIKKTNEPCEVNTKYKNIKRNVTNPKVCICYKIIVPSVDGEEKFKKRLFMNLLMDMKFGNTTSFEKDLVKDKITKTGVLFSCSYFDNIVLLFFQADVINKDEFINRINKRLTENNFDKNIFELNKKACLSSTIRSFDNPSGIANIIESNIINYGKIINNVYDIYKNYEFDKFVSEFIELNFDNSSILYVD